MLYHKIKHLFLPVKFIGLPLFVFIGLHLVMFPLSPTFSGIAQILLEISMLILMISLPILLISIIHLFYKKTSKEHLFKIFPVIFINFLLFVAVWWSFYKIRDARMYFVTKQLEPLITSINKYKKNENHYPKTLNLLIPKYISNLPSTGMCGYPEYEYSTNNKGFIISLPVSIGILNWDEFQYSSSGKYNLAGGSTKNINGWIYLYE